MEDKLYTFSYKLLIANAFYAIQESKLSYEAISSFRKIFYRLYTKGYYEYIMFSNSDGNVLKFGDECFFVKENDGVLCLSYLDEAFINRINGIYPEEIQNILTEARERFAKEQHKLTLNNKNDTKH